MGNVRMTRFPFRGDGVTAKGPKVPMDTALRWGCRVKEWKLNFKLKCGLRVRTLDGPTDGSGTGAIPGGGPDDTWEIKESFCQVVASATEMQIKPRLEYSDVTEERILFERAAWTVSGKMHTAGVEPGSDDDIEQNYADVVVTDVATLGTITADDPDFSSYDAYPPAGDAYLHGQFSLFKNPFSSYSSGDHGEFDNQAPARLDRPHAYVTANFFADIYLEIYTGPINDVFQMGFSVRLLPDEGEPDADTATRDDQEGGGDSTTDDDNEPDDITTGLLDGRRVRLGIYWFKHPELGAGFSDPESLDANGHYLKKGLRMIEDFVMEPVQYWTYGGKYDETTGEEA